MKSFDPQRRQVAVKPGEPWPSDWINQFMDTEISAPTPGVAEPGADDIVRSALEIHRPGLPVALVAPGALKRFATGKGSADKTAMVIAARDRLGYQAIDHNEADALWLRQIGMHLLGVPEVDLPKAHLTALDKIERPEGLR